MIAWIFAALALHVIHVFTPAALFLPAEGIGRHLSGRDDLPEPSVLVGRARRAQANWSESLPVFLTLAVLALLLEGAKDSAAMGAGIFVVARAVYLPLYLISVPGLRSAAWLIAVAGLAVMLLALV